MTIKQLDPPKRGYGRTLQGPLDEGWSLRRLEDEYIRAVLQRAGGNRNRAARILGIDRRTLYRRLRHLSS